MLANRISAMLGNSPAEIQQLYQKVMNFYRFRSESLHEGNDSNITDTELHDLENITREVFITDLKVFSVAILIFSIVLFENAYKREKLKEKENVTFVLEHQVKEITGKAKVTGVALEDGTVIDVDGVFVAFGSVPQTALVKDLVELDPAGYVKADETGETSLAGLYVAGDVRTKKLRQVVTAVSDGANAATAVAEYLK